MVKVPSPMKVKVVSDGTQRTFAVALESGEEVLKNLQQFADEQRLAASQFTAIGAFSSVVLGFFDFARKDYNRIPIDEQVEVVSLIGDIALTDGKSSIHPHVVVAKSDGTAHGGHLLEARVHPILELIVTESPAHLRRKHDEESGLALLAP